MCTTWPQDQLQTELWTHLVELHPQHGPYILFEKASRPGWRAIASRQVERLVFGPCSYVTRRWQRAPAET